MTTTFRDLLENGGVSENLPIGRVPDVGAAWDKHPGYTASGRNLRLFGNSSVTTSSGNADLAFYYSPTLPPSATRQRVQLTLLPKSLIAGQYVAAVARLHDGATLGALGKHYRLSVTDTNYVIVREVDGATATIYSVAHGLTFDGVARALTWDLETTAGAVEHTVRVDGALAISAPDSATARLVPADGGYFGLRAGGAQSTAGGGLHVADVEVNDEGAAIAAATRIVVTQQPADAVIGQSFPAIIAEAQNDGGAVDPAYNGAVSVDWGENPGQAPALAGTITKQFVNGLVTFADLSSNTLNDLASLSLVDASPTGALGTVETGLFNVTLPAGTGAGAVLGDTMAYIDLDTGAVDQSVDVYLHDTAGAPLTLEATSPGAAFSYQRGGAAAVAVPLVALGSDEAAHADGGFIAYAGMPGWHRLDLPDAIAATEGKVRGSLAFSGAVAVPLDILVNDAAPTVADVGAAAWSDPTGAAVVSDLTATKSAAEGLRADIPTARAGKLDFLDAAVSSAVGGLTPDQAAKLEGLVASADQLLDEVAPGGAELSKTATELVRSVVDTKGVARGSWTYTFNTAGRLVNSVFTPAA